MSKGLTLQDKVDRLISLQRAVPKQRWGGYDRFRQILGPEQLAVVDDDAALIAACKGRRAGGTTAGIGKVLRVFDRWTYGKVFYFAPSDEQGVDILWEDLVAYNRDFGLGLEERWSDREWRLGGRVLQLVGFNTEADVDRVRGQKSRLAWIDEAQMAPEWFTKQVTDAIMPTTLDYLGQVMATGTPAPVADGFFFDACHAPSGWSNAHHWTAAHNPFFIRAGRDPLKEARERFGLTEDSVTYQREWLALWVVDPDALVYAIPESAIKAVTGPWYGNYFGLDLGWKDHDAIGVMGIPQHRLTSHLRHMETKGQQTNHQLFARILELAGQFPGPAGANGQPHPIVVYDPAGHATKKTIETFRSDAPQIQWVQAEKSRKVEYIDWLNTDLRTGSTTVEPGSPMIREARRLRWKRPGKVAEDADHSDMGDAWLYPNRYCRGLLRKLPTKVQAKPQDPFEEYMAKRAEMEAAGMGHHERRLRGL